MREMSFPLIVKILIVFEMSSGRAMCADKVVKKIAPTVADATKVFDPLSFPVLKTDQPVTQKYVGGFTYQALSGTESAWKFHQKELLKLQWKEIPNSYLSEMSCSGTFEKKGYLLSVSVFQTMPEKVMVTISNHSNIPLNKLPTPKGVKPFHGSPVNASYITPAGKEETVAAVRKLLVEQGWEPYGSAGDQIFLKQNAVRLSAFVTTAPAQDNQTVITYSAEQLSADIPVPEETIGLQYSDSTKTVSYDVEADLETVNSFYNESLKRDGWKPTLDKPTPIGFR